MADETDKAQRKRYALDSECARVAGYDPVSKSAAASKTDYAFHSQRHAGNSVLAQAGVPLRVLQSRLGHSTAAIRLSTHTHLMPSDGKVAADTVGALLAGGQTSGQTEGVARKRYPYRKEKTLANTGVSMVGHPGFEPGTSCLSSMRSNQLS
jgi:hypothetical protein